MDSKSLNQSPPFIRFYSLRFRSGDRLTTMEARNFVSKSITQLIQSASKVETPIPNPLKPSRNHTSSSSFYPISKVPPSIT
ncbi:hypothetical protein Lal_00025107 [Lupinus albus]|nr:hypothetical protein Lal_00025107 [Lupinus albus]